jgi:2-amino-4-hydroxy-6-hydroxymethyldihydropteridine diphosphokinase
MENGIVSDAPRHHAYLVLGSNRDATTNLPRAARALAGHGEVAATSSVYETAPVGTADPARFLNAALHLITALTPERLKGDVIPGIETTLGRERDPADRFAPRTIDIDIVLWDERIGTILGRPVPDPDLLRHLHVVWPLAEIAPDLRHPGDGRTLAEIAAALATEAPSAALPVLRHDVILTGG